MKELKKILTSGHVTQHNIYTGIVLGRSIKNKFKKTPLAKVQKYASDNEDIVHYFYIVYYGICQF